METAKDTSAPTGDAVSGAAPAPAVVDAELPVGDDTQVPADDDKPGAVDTDPAPVPVVDVVHPSDPPNLTRSGFGG